MVHIMVSVTCSLLTGIKLNIHVGLASGLVMGMFFCAVASTLWLTRTEEFVWFWPLQHTIVSLF